MGLAEGRVVNFTARVLKDEAIKLLIPIICNAQERAVDLYIYS